MDQLNPEHGYELPFKNKEECEADFAKFKSEIVPKLEHIEGHIADAINKLVAYIEYLIGKL